MIVSISLEEKIETFIKIAAMHFLLINSHQLKKLVIDNYMSYLVSHSVIRDYSYQPFSYLVN